MNSDKKMSRGGGGLAVRSTLSSVQFFNALNKQIQKEVLQKQIRQYGRLQTAASSGSGDELVDDSDDLTNNNGEVGRLGNTVQPEALKAQIEAMQQHLALGDQMPYIQAMETVVLFADISGFTAVSEACSGMGIRGNEELSFVINRYMEGMVKNLSKFGGDIIKFVGDAMIVMWPRKSKQNQGDDEEGDDEEKVLIIRKAIQCAMDIQKDMHNKKITANVTSLKVKIGIGWGKCALLYVGGVFNRSEFFTVGVGLERALESEGHATEGGQIIVNESAWKHVKNQYYEGEFTATSNKFYRVTGCKIGVKGGADAILMKNSMKLDRIAGIQQTLRSCVPAAIMPYLEIGFESYGSETRTLTVMFASLGVEFSDTSHTEGRNKIQKILTVVQQQVYRMGGSLNKLMMDDKGCTLVCIWGASPMAHVDDAARAVLCALNMRRALNKVQGTWCNVGIATGEVFSGVVGTSGSRKEFSCLGDTVNLAARIMCVPKKKKIHGGIMCEIRTKNEAMNQITFSYAEHAEFKGKSVGYSIYEPVDPYEEFPCTYLQDSRTTNKIIQPQCLLKLGYNPLVVQRDVNHRKYEDLYEKKIPYVNQIYDTIKNFFFGPNQEAGRSPLNIIIHGEIGSGKTQTVRTLCQKLQSDQDLTQAQQLNAISLNKSALMNQAELMKQATSSQVRLPIFAAAPNAETRMQFLGSWRPILRSMFEFRRKQLDLKVADMLRMIIQKDYDKMDLLLEIFGFAPSARYVTSDDHKQQKINFGKLRKEVLDGQPDVVQVKELGASDPNWFVNREKYGNSAVDCVLDVCAFFIKDFLGEASYDSISRSDSESKNADDASVDLSELSSTKKGSRIKKSFAQSHLNRSNVGLRDLAKQMCILIFDNAHLLEEESWSLILRLYGSCSNISIIMVVNQTFKGSPIMPQLEKQPSSGTKRGPGTSPEELPYYYEDQPLEKLFMKDAKIFDTPSLNAKALQQTLIELAPIYQESFLEENRLKTAYNGPVEGVPKTPKICKEWMKRLTLEYNLGRVFTSVDDKLCNLLVQRCEGNITVCLQYFLELLLNGYTMINERNEVVMKKSLERCILLQNFTKIPVPSCIHKRRLRNLDEFLQKRNQKQNQRKKELFIKGIMVLKAAAVIGEEFGTAALKKILPLREETNGSLAQILKELEQNDLIETLDETDPKNIHCRFNKSFLRESVYQVMLFKDQKQYLHSQLAEYLQSLPTSVLDPHQSDIELLKLREHVMIGEDIKDFKDLPLKQKQGLIVKEMQSKLVRNNQKAILHKDWVFKQGKAANKKISQRFLIMTARELMWFHSVEEYESGATALGVIKIMDIYKCSETLMQQGTYDFDIGFTNYIKKGQADSMPRIMNFGCKSESERHEWISRIEFLRAKTVYENYVNKFVNIQFPLKKVDDIEDDSQQKNELIFEKLNHFGKNFKQNVKVNAAAFHKPAMPAAFGLKRTTTNFRGRGWDPSALIGRTAQVAGHRNSFRSSLEPHTAAVVDDTSSEYFSQRQQNNVTAKDLASKVLQLYRASIVAFHVQTTVHANKTQYQTMKNKPIGQLPDYFEIEGAVPNKESLQRERDSFFLIQQQSEAGVQNRTLLPMKKTASEGAGATGKALRQDLQIQATTKQPRRRVSLTDEVGSGTPLGGKPRQMEIVQEQDREGSQGSSSDSGENRGVGQARIEKVKKERGDLTPEPVVPFVGPKTDDLKKEVDSIRRPRKSEHLPDQARQVQIEHARQTSKQSSNDPPAGLDTRNKDQLQSSQGKKSGDSGRQVTAMIEQIEHERTLHPSQSQANAMNAAHQDRPDGPYLPVQAPRVDRGFTIHDIAARNRGERQAMESDEQSLSDPRYYRDPHPDQAQLQRQLRGTAHQQQPSLRRKAGKKDSIPSQYDPLLPNGAQHPQMQIDGVSSIKDEQLLSATGAEFGFGMDKEMNFEYQSQNMGPQYNGPPPQGQLRPYSTPQQFAAADGRLLPSATVPRLAATHQLQTPDQSVLSAPALQETINQHVQKEVNKSLQRFFARLNESYEKSGLQNQSARSGKLAGPQLLGGAGSPQIPQQFGHAPHSARGAPTQPPYHMDHPAAGVEHSQEYAQLGLQAPTQPQQVLQMYPQPQQSYLAMTAPLPQGQLLGPPRLVPPLSFAQLGSREGPPLQEPGRAGMLKNKVLSERSLLSKQTEQDDDDEVLDPNDEERLYHPRTQQPLQGYQHAGGSQAQRSRPTGWSHGHPDQRMRSGYGPPQQEPAHGSTYHDGIAAGHRPKAAPLGSFPYAGGYGDQQPARPVPTSGQKRSQKSLGKRRSARPSKHEPQLY